MTEQADNYKSRLSGTERGELNLAKFRDYLDKLRNSGRVLPMEGGKPNITAIAEESGIKRNAFYTNSGIKKLLQEFLGTFSSMPPADRLSNQYQEQVERLERRVLQLEQQLASTQAENHELRRRLAEAEQRLVRYQIIEEDVLKAGRRIIL